MALPRDVRSKNAHSSSDTRRAKPRIHTLWRLIEAPRTLNGSPLLNGP
jgi:hypothetical protein